MIKLLKTALPVTACLLVSACATVQPTDYTPTGVKPAQATPLTDSGKELRKLPSPKGKIPVAMYNFRDKTGQYKSSTSNSYSTAITQGAGSILLKSLLESGWFTPVEREGLNDLLTERKIRAKQFGNDAVPLMTSAPVMLEGGIIGYESNIRTGGIGAAYLGIGASSKYREDQVTVNLRIVDVDTGEILSSVNTSKSIFSQQIASSVFNFIRFKELAEFEAGYSFNEPAQLCVTDAIESALINLIAEGIEKGFWSLKNPDDIGHPLIRKYLQETQV